jgi:acetyl esterase/lipase
MRRSTFLLTAGLTLALLSNSSARADPAPAEAPAKKYEVEAVRDLAYYDGPNADPVKHKLDLFLPKGAKDFPVLFFVHGGAWRQGDKSFFGVYSTLGLFFARHGVGTVVTNYRLSPGVRHPEHIKDVARAFAWTCKHIGEYGGRADQVFACGHSAGGHLVSLLATDESYLKAEGLSTRAIKGVMPISGVYDIPENLFPGVFGTDPELRKQAAPLSHVHAGTPPFLILYADKDFPTCDRMSEDFCKALKEQKCEARAVEVKKRTHITILVQATVEDDPVSRELLEFIHKQCQRPGNAVKAAGGGE